jgi:hypothetical protein
VCADGACQHPPLDADGDGYASISCGGGDCDDGDPAVRPGAAEVCDGIDNDCDSQTDEGCPVPDCTIDTDCVSGEVCRDGNCVPEALACSPVGSSEACGRCNSGLRTCLAGNQFGPCQGEQGCLAGDTQPCDTCSGSNCLPCGTQTCVPATCTMGSCQGPAPYYVCDQCGTGTCRDYLVHEDDPACGCASDVAAPNCNATSYDVSCGCCGWFCTYERHEVTQDCNCRWECP